MNLKAIGAKINKSWEANIKYCKNCRQNVKIKEFGIFWIFVAGLGLLLFIVPGLIVFVWRMYGLGECPICKSSMNLTDQRRNEK